MKLSLLAIAVLAVALVGLVKADDSLLVGAGAEIELVEEEPQQNDEEVQDEVEEAVQDEPISEPDASDDDASLDEPEDASADDYDSSEEVSDEPTAELDPTEEPTVPSEEEGEGFEGAEELHADDGINYDEEFRADDDGELEWADDNGTEEEEEVGEEEGEEGEEGGEEEEVGEEEEGGDDDEVYVERAEVREKRATTKKAPPKTTKKPTPKTTKKPTVKTTKKPVVQTTKKPAPTNPPPHPSPFVAWNDKIRCTGPQLRGPCNKNIKRWHYNAVTNQCSPFEYSGCGGNDNNWIYLGNCQKVCVKKPPPTPKPKPKPALKWNDKKRCQGPVVAGPCRAAVKRYHYNAAKDTCETFTWGGCQPVPNNWVYIKNCQKVCVTKKKPAPVKWNDPRRCVGEKIRGNCKSDLKRYHYNAATDKCELFSYSGCGGNINNWQYIKNCQKICVKNKPTPPAKLNWDDKRRCDGPVVRGPCKKEIRRFHYDATRDQCLPFVYGGCEGNHNNWVYRKNCQKICKVKKLAWDDPNRCKGPEIRGPCNKNIRRYHYDAALDKCVPFSYGGCAGNDNNWWYIKNCQRICVKKNEPDTPPKPVWNDPIRCQGSVEVGTCDKSIRRYHYNPDTNKCEPFQYSGCGGNNNNWWYINNCRKVCVKPDSDDDGHEGGGGDGGDVPSGGDNPSGVDQDDIGSGSVPVPDGGFGGLGFVEAPTECSSGDGSISIKVPKACPLVLCSKRCKYGFVADASGCPTCYCSRPACDELQSLLTGR